jgi:four helix bundle protein
MVKIASYTDIKAWQKAQELGVCLYRLLKTSKDYSFCDQIRRASISVSNNIAEGYGRYGLKEFRHYLTIAKGSNLEVQSMIYLGSNIGHFSTEDRKKLLSLTFDIDNLIKAFIKSIMD